MAQSRLRSVEAARRRVAVQAEATARCPLQHRSAAALSLLRGPRKDLYRAPHTPRGPRTPPCLKVLVTS